MIGMISSLALSLLFVVLFTSFSDACMRVTPGTPGMPAVPCKSCAQDLITITMNGGGSKAFATDTTDTTGACAVRTLTCTGPNAGIDVNNGDDGNIPDGGTGTATINPTCNAAGTAWVFMGITITQLECATTG